MPKQFAALAGALLAVTLGTPVSVLRGQGDPNNEQILSYHSDITVNPDATLLVRETISVTAAGARIKHGISRDFPTQYHDRLGNAYVVHMEVVSAERDGESEDYHLEKLSNGLRIDLGQSHKLVSPGEHSYELTYTVNRELGFFPDHDELYWNVTGNGWTFPIQEASATVHLPQGIAREAILLDAYTGPRGSVGNDYTASADDQGNADFRTTRPLGLHEGLTIVVRWPKGFVRPPTAEDQYRYFLEDNRVTLRGCLGLIMLLIYSTFAWFWLGRDPASGPIMPRSEPPRGLSPAAVRYVNRMAFDQKAMVANLLDLAVKKQLTIKQDDSGVYTLTQIAAGTAAPSPAPSATGRADSPITADEKLLLGKLFSGRKTIRLEPANHLVVGGALEALHRKLRSTLEQVYFLKNSHYLIPGMLISLAFILWCGFSIQGAQKFVTLFATVWLLPWSLACAALARGVWAAWRNVFSDPHHPGAALHQTVLSTAFAVPFFFLEAAALSALVWAASPAVALVLFVLVLTTYLFHELLKRSTHAGRVLLDQIEGFRMFLGAVEKDRHRMVGPPARTADLFEKFLPYAMALNVEKVWSEKYASVLSPAAQAGTTPYSPRWYSGPHWDPLNGSLFATSMGNSFSSAIASASTAPGSGFGAGRGSSSRRGGSSRGEGRG